MMNKPRYWHVAYPLAVTALCVAPQEFFARTWNTCFEHSLGKFKVCYDLAHDEETRPFMIHIGKDTTSTGLEWDLASRVDIFVSMP